MKYTLSKLPEDVIYKISNYLYHDFIIIDKTSYSKILNEVSCFKVNNMKKLLEIDNFIFSLKQLLFRWLCLDKNENILKFIERNNYCIDFDNYKENDNKLTEIVERMTLIQFISYRKFCLYS